MLSTKSLCFPFSTIFANIHHPLPLDQRESQRLLKALTVSFRSHLDREHGFLSHEHSPVKLRTLMSPQPSASTHDAHQRPTDRHVRAILSNPLFRYEPSRPLPSSLSDEHDPMDVFDRAVAKGLMNPRRATGVLIAKRKAVANSSSVAVNDGIAASGTAHRVVSWLRSSGLERDLNSVKYQPLLQQLIPFMVEEGLDEVVWMWLETLIRNMPAHNAVSHVSPILSALIRAKVSPGTPLDAGYSTILAADSMFSKYLGFRRASLEPWKTLSLLSTVFAWQRKTPSEALFDSFVAMSDPLRGLDTSIQVDRAHLDLHHPTRPDASAALECLRSPMLDRLRDGLKGLWDTAQDIGCAKTQAKSVVLMASDAAQYLTRIGEEDQAAWVSDLLLDKLGNFMRTELVSASPELHRLENRPLTT